MKHIYLTLFSLLLLSATATAQTTLPLTFEGNTADIVFEGFEGADSAIEANPDVSGENTSATIMRTTKTVGAQFFAGTFVTLDEAIDFSETTAVSVTTWSPKANIPVRLRLENADNSIGIELDVNTTVANEWETLTWNFAAVPDADFVKVVIFFEFIDGLAGDGSTYYFDNVQLGGSDPADDVVLPLTFEDEDLNYNFVAFEGAASQIIDNPDASGINTSDRVMETIKTNGAQFFAGTAINLNQPIDFTTSRIMEMSSWSPKVGIPVKLRLEDAGNTAGIELDANTTVGSEWETLSYDFSNLVDPNVDYVRVVVFYEFIVDLPGDGTTYYFDNITVDGLSSTNELAAINAVAYPNPSSDQWVISTQNDLIQEVRLYDALGQEVYTARPNTISATVAARQLAPGIYLARVKTSAGQGVVRLVKR